MGRSSRYSPEVRERSVRMVLEHTAEYDSQWAAICSISAKIGCSPETLRTWVRQAERDQGDRPGLTTDERQRLEEREIRELRRANEILRKASAYFAQAEQGRRAECSGGARGRVQSASADPGGRGRTQPRNSPEKPERFSRKRTPVLRSRLDLVAQPLKRLLDGVLQRIVGLSEAVFHLVPV